MPDLLLEFYSEEIPARMQARAGGDLVRIMTETLTQAGLPVGTARYCSGPRRIAFIAEGVPAQSAPSREERKGPRVGSPAKAVEGFLRAAGLTSLEDCEVVKDPKGDYYLAKSEKPGRSGASIIAEAVPVVVRKFPWPKSMRWGSGRIRWIRPLHSILCLFDGKPIEFEVDGIKSGDITFGHRFLSGSKVTQPKMLRISKNADYPEVLLHAKVVVTGERRAEAILDGARKAAGEAGLALVEDHGLLLENAGLVEWPVVLSGKFDASFLEVPEEILMTAMKTHQKCFSLRDEKSGKLANRFILISNLEAEDGGKAIIAGNERVIRARLSDAKFFWDNDRARPLAALTSALKDVTFHEKLGTQFERVKRVEKLSRELAPLVGADTDDAARAAYLAKADLLSGTVGEFPELQGIIGRYIALAQGEKHAVADAIAEHYQPQGPSDAVPSNSVSIAVALADKLDMLVGFWAIEEKPTGSKDPFALRRAALGIIRIILENELRLNLTPIVFLHANRFPNHDATETSVSILDFFYERLKVQLRDQGARHDLAGAVFRDGMRAENTTPAMASVCDLLMIVRRLDALERFLKSGDGAGLLALVRRALNILRIEEKKEARIFDGKPSSKLLVDKEEKTLSAAIKSTAKDVRAALAAEQFEDAMAALAKLRAPVDAFFERVTVNADSAEIRANRLMLLGQIRSLTLEIADFGKIEG